MKRGRMSMGSIVRALHSSANASPHLASLGCALSTRSPPYPPHHPLPLHLTPFVLPGCCAALQCAPWG